MRGKTDAGGLVLKILIELNSLTNLSGTGA